MNMEWLITPAWGNDIACSGENLYHNDESIGIWEDVENVALVVCDEETEQN